MEEFMSFTAKFVRISSNAAVTVWKGYEEILKKLI